MTRLAAASACALAFLAGCTEQQGQPVDMADLPTAIPPAQQAPFDMDREIGVAVAACVTSERQGPATLQSLRDQGYFALRDGGGVVYAKEAPRTDLRAPSALRVSDPNDRLGCRIEVPRQSAYTHRAQVAAALRSQGFAKVAERADSERYARDDLRLMLTAGSSTYDQLATIELRRMTASSDITCRDATLPAQARQGC